MTDTHLGDVSAADFDALVIPGGVANPDSTAHGGRRHQDRPRLFAVSKPMAAICHGPRVLAEADVLSGRTVTSLPSIRTDLKNAGAQLVDEEVVVDGKLITSPEAR